MGQSLAQIAYNNLLYKPAAQYANNPEYAAGLRDPWASELYAKGWINPAVDDVYSADTANRVFQQNILPGMSWQDLLKSSFQEMGGQMGTPDLPVYDNLVRRLEATGWSDEQKKQAVLNAANQHYATFGSSYTGWSTEEGIAAFLGLPDYSRAAHDAAQQQYSDQHASYSAQADADSLANALKLGSVVAAPFVVGGLTSSGLIPAGTVEGFGTSSTLADAAWGVNAAADLAPSTIGPATGTILEPGVAASGAISTPVSLTPTLAELGATAIPAGLNLSSIPTSTPPSSGDASVAEQVNTPSGTTATPSGVGNVATNTAAAGTALGRILDGTATAADWASILGTVGSTALGVYGSNELADTLRQISDQARTDRLPFLNKSLEWLNDPAAYAAGPGKSALDATLRALSVSGNPIGNPASLAIAGDIANKGWQNAVTGFGNIGLAGEDTRSQLLSSAATADRGVTSSLASGLGSLTQQDNSLESILRRLGGAGLNLGSYIP